MRVSRVAIPVAVLVVFFSWWPRERQLCLCRLLLGATRHLSRVLLEPRLCFGFQLARADLLEGAKGGAWEKALLMQSELG